MSDEVLKVLNLKTFYTVDKKNKKYIKAVNDISFSLKKKMTIGIVGESGCGKSTLVKTLMGVEKKKSGEIFFENKNIKDIKSRERYDFIQMVFQNPLDSLNPRKKAWEIISDPLLIRGNISKNKCFERAIDLMKLVGLSLEQANKYPHMFSGGQQQRIGIARALILRPKVLILDEPVSALDVSVQAQILNLLKEIQEKFEISYIFIGHDLSVVNYIADKVMVMYFGKVSEYGSSSQVLKNPHHPYTKILLKSSYLSTNQAIADFPEIENGELPDHLNPPTGCFFKDRCPLAKNECRIAPPLENKYQRLIACYL